MLNRLKHFFEDKLIPPSTNADGGDKHALQLALAALMIEVAESDYQDAPEERAAIEKIVKQSFDLKDREANEVIDMARKEHADSTDYFQFTRLINDHYSAQQKIQLIENLWRIAFADNNLDKYEEHVIRRIADLLYVSHSDFMATKLRVQKSN